MLRVQTERIERVTISCPIEDKEQAEEFCRAYGYHLIQSREEKPTDNGRIFTIVAHKDITHELTVDDYMEMAIGDAWVGEEEL